MSSHIQRKRTRTAPNPMLPEAVSRPQTTSTRTHLSERAAFLTVLVVWSLLLVSVQPWSSSDSATGGESSTLKGVVLAVCVVTLIIALPPRSAFRVPLPIAIYLVYAFYLLLTAWLLPDSVSVAIRSARLLTGLLLPVLLWPLLYKRPERLLYVSLLAYLALAISVVAGLVSGSGKSWLDGVPFSSGGRLMGAYLPMMPPRVGEIGAICIGLVVILWAARKVPIWSMALVVPLGGALIMLSRTRTAPLALLLGLLLAFVLTVRSPLGRRGITFLLALIVAAAPFSVVVLNWTLRNQDAQMLGKLSGRTLVWEHILSQQVLPVTMWLGRGLGEKKVLLRRGEGDINVMAIDNSWLDAYWETGLLGMALIGLVMAVALIYAIRTPGPLARSAAVFLVVYVLVASINESGLCDLSSMTLLMLVAVTVGAADRASFSAKYRDKVPVRLATGTRATKGPTVQMPDKQQPVSMSFSKQKKETQQ